MSNRHLGSTSFYGCTSNCLCSNRLLLISAVLGCVVASYLFESGIPGPSVLLLTLLGLVASVGLVDLFHHLVSEGGERSRERTDLLPHAGHLCFLAILRQLHC